MKEGTNFLTANIDRAIVMTQYDLRGFAHPLGFRIKNRHPKYLEATACNFMAFAAGLNDEGQSTDKDYSSSLDRRPEDYLAMCKRLVEDCDLSEKEAIQLLIQDMIKWGQEVAVLTASGKVPQKSWANYDISLTRETCYGMVVLALAEAFEVDAKNESAAA